MYFPDRTTEQLLDLVLQLASDLSATRARLRTLEMALGASVDAHQHSAAERAELDRDRDALLGRLLRIMTEDPGPEAPLRAQWQQALPPVSRSAGSSPG